MTTEQILGTIIGKAPALAGAASSALLAVRNGSPVAEQRVANVARIALEDHASAFTPDERLALANLLTDTSDETRTVTKRVRLTPSEVAQLEIAAEAAGMSVSEYIRQRLFGT